MNSISNYIKWFYNLTPRIFCTTSKYLKREQKWEFGSSNIGIWIYSFLSFMAVFILSFMVTSSPKFKKINIYFQFFKFIGMLTRMENVFINEFLPLSLWSLPPLSQNIKRRRAFRCVLCGNTFARCSARVPRRPSNSRSCPAACPSCTRHNAFLTAVPASVFQIKTVKFDGNNLKHQNHWHFIGKFCQGYCISKIITVISRS